MTTADRRLTLVRHAKSDWGDAALDDFDRPLNERGRRDAPDMASRLLTADLVPSLMISSPALRAMTTARVFAAAFGYPAARIQQADTAYLASPQQLLEIVRTLGGKAQHVMLFGHNPGISKFAALLTAGETPGDVPTCAVTSLRVPVKHWSELEFGSARPDFYDFPKSGR